MIQKCAGYYRNKCLKEFSLNKKQIVKFFEDQNVSCKFWEKTYNRNAAFLSDSLNVKTKSVQHFSARRHRICERDVAKNLGF